MDRKIVPYSEAREFIKSGDALCFRDTDLVSRVIQVFGRSDVNHIGMAAWWDDDLMILETKATGGQGGLLSNRLKGYRGQVDVYRVTECKAITEKAVASMRKVTGGNYGWLGFLRVSLLHLPVCRFLVHPDLDDMSVTKDPPFCSHAFTWSYRQSGMDLVRNLADCMTEPGDLTRSPFFKYQFTLSHG